MFTQAFTHVWFDVTIIDINTILVDLSPTFYCLPKPLLEYSSMLLLSALILSSSDSIIVVVLGYDWGLRIVINITCVKYQEMFFFVFTAFEYPSMTNKEIKQYTSVLFTQAPIHVCLHGTIIDSRTIFVTMYYCGHVGV